MPNHYSYSFGDERSHGHGHHGHKHGHHPPHPLFGPNIYPPVFPHFSTAWPPVPGILPIRQDDNQ